VITTAEDTATGTAEDTVTGTAEDMMIIAKAVMNRDLMSESW